MTPLQVRASEKADPPMSSERIARLKDEVGAALQETKKGKATAKAKSTSKTDKTSKQKKQKKAAEDEENALESEESLSEEEQGSEEDGEKKTEEKACFSFCS